MACYAAFIATLVAIGTWQRYGIAYYVGVAVAAAICGWHYVLIRRRTREGCFKAFLGNNWVGLAVLAGILLDNNPVAGFTAWLPK